MDAPNATDPTLEQLNVRLPAEQRSRLQRLARDGGVSMNALLGAVLQQFLARSEEGADQTMLAHARHIDTARRRRPHLSRPGRTRSRRQG